MELTDGYRVAPGRCVKCGTAESGKPVVDLVVPDPGVFVRTHRVYLCAECAIQVGRLIAPALGLAVVKEGALERLNAEVVEAVESSVKTAARAERAETVLRDLRNFEAETLP